MKSYRTLALKELLSQKVTSILILIAVVLSTMMTTIVGQSIGVLSAMREQQAIAIGGNRYATFLQMNADQLHALEQDERLSYVGKSIYMGSLELSPSLTLGLMEYLDDTAAIYPSSTSVEEGRLPEAPMEIALSEDILKYLGFEGGIGDKITLSLQKNLRHNIADSYSYTAEFVLTGILKNNYLGYTSGTVTGVVGEGTAEQLLPESYIYYNVDIQTADKKSFQAVVDDINKELNIHELDTSYNIVYLNALGISYTANSEGANDKGFSFMTVAGILVGTLILLAAGLVIYNILKISVSKRIKGYGTLRAIGGEKGQLYQIIVIEVILLCLIGIPIGMLLGFLSARGILEAATGLVSPELFLVQDASELKTLIAENSSLNGTLLVLSGAITLAFALFAALPAARSAARVSPIMAMSGTNLKIRRRKRKTKKIHNFEAYYARLNLKRNKGRTVITILSLVMSITVFIALQGFSSLLNAASALQDNHVGDYQITNESIGFTTDDLNTLRKNEAVQSVAAIQFSLYEQNENGLLDEISLEFQLKPGETFQVVGLNDEYWDYFMGDQLPEEQLGQLKAGNACIVRNPIPMSYGEDVLKFTNIEAGENICVAGMELNVLKTLDGYDGYLGIGNGGFTNGVQVIVDDAGLRREEILALQWDSVYLDTDTPYLTVRRAWHTEHNRPVISDELKTKAAERNIPLPVCLAECLKAAKETSTSEYVVSNRDGEPLSYTQFKRLWQYIVTRTVKERSYYRYEDGKRVKHTVTPVLGQKAAHNGKVVYNLDFEVTPHQLRHTYITNLIHASVDPKTVQYLAGHESSKITMDIYAKVKYNRPDELVRSMSCAFASWDVAQ